MRYFVLMFVTLAAQATSPSGTVADEPKSLLLDFSRPMDSIVRGAIPVPGKWKHYITLPKEPGKTIRDTREIAKFISVVPDDANACQLRSRENYVGMARLLKEEFVFARRLTWEWSVAKHPHNGRLGETPNDQSILIYVFYRERDSENDSYNYTGLGFCWTAKTRKKTERLTAMMPWSNSPRATIHHLSLRDGPAEGLHAQEVELVTEYRKAFNRDPPQIWGVVLLADSNSVTPDIGTMTTDAIIRDIQFHR